MISYPMSRAKARQRQRRPIPKPLTPRHQQPLLRHLLRQERHPAPMQRWPLRSRWVMVTTTPRPRPPSLAHSRPMKRIRPLRVVHPPTVRATRVFAPAQRSTADDCCTLRQATSTATSTQDRTREADGEAEAEGRAQASAPSRCWPASRSASDHHRSCPGCRCAIIIIKSTGCYG